MNKNMQEYQAQLKKGHIQIAYKGLMQYFKDLRTHFHNQHPDYSVPSNIYFGNMDLTFFAFSPPTLKTRKLKIQIAFIHETCHFELWLAGVNKNYQTRYLNLIRENNWNRYPTASSTKGVDYIVKSILVDDPNFDELEALTESIEKSALQFVKDFDGFLEKYED